MKSLSKILLTVILTCGICYTYAKSVKSVKVKTYYDVQDRHLSGFNAVDAEGSFDVYITQGPAESVKVDAPADVLDRIITEVVGGTLRIHNKHNHETSSSWNNNKKVKVYVTVRDINTIDISGSGDAFFKDGIHTDNLKISVSGSGDVYGKIETKVLICSISGSGNMKLNGHTENSTVRVSGSGNYNGENVSTSITTVQVSGSGNANINANNSINAHVSGSGNVRYTGGAQHVIKSKSGSGSISGNNALQ